MGYTVKQKMEICLKREQDPTITQHNLALWAQKRFGDEKPPAQTTISRILQAKSELVAARENDFGLTRRRKVTNPLLRRILTEWVAQAVWESIPITTPIIQLTAYTIWTRLPTCELDGNGIFTKKWSVQFYRNLELNIRGRPEDIQENVRNLPLNKVWRSDDKVELKLYLADIIRHEQYAPQDIFSLDEFPLFYTLPLDQIFDVSSVDKGLRQASSSTELSLTLMLGCNVTGTEKLPPLVVGKYEQFDISDSDLNLAQKMPAFTASSPPHTTNTGFANKLNCALGISYKSNTNKWITSSMFHEFLLTWDHQLANRGGDRPRKVLLLLDDSSSHRILNLKFEHIRLCYLENSSRHINHYSGNSIKIDCLPMHYGIVQEFKKLFRQKHYRHMIEKQRQRSNLPPPDGLISPGPKPGLASLGDEVLSHPDYRVPLARALCWIKDAWNDVSEEATFWAWRDSRLLPLSGDWPQSTKNPARDAIANDLLKNMRQRCLVFDRSANYVELSRCILSLNVVMPWDPDQLLALVNERAKVTLNYGSIEEIIGSCILEPYPVHECNTIKYAVSPPADIETLWSDPPLSKNHTIQGQAPIELFANELAASINLPASIVSTRSSLLAPSQDILRSYSNLRPIYGQSVPVAVDMALQSNDCSGSFGAPPVNPQLCQQPGPDFGSPSSFSSLPGLDVMSGQASPSILPANSQARASPLIAVSGASYSPAQMSPWNVDSRGALVPPDLLGSRSMDLTISPSAGKVRKRKIEYPHDTSKLGDKRRQHLQLFSRRPGSITSPPTLGPTTNRIFGQLPRLPIPYSSVDGMMQPHQDLRTSIRQILECPSLSLSENTIRELQSTLGSLGNELM